MLNSLYLSEDEHAFSIQYYCIPSVQEIIWFYLITLLSLTPIRGS